jgi:hypothetical protein
VVYYDKDRTDKFLELSHIFKVDSQGEVKPPVIVQPFYDEITYSSKLISEQRFTQDNTLCQNFVFLNHLKKSIFVCKDNDARWYLLIKCSDNSCSDKKEMLKISENRRDKTTGLSIKLMPGVSTTSSLTIFSWF